MPFTLRRVNFIEQRPRALLKADCLFVFTQLHALFYLKHASPIFRRVFFCAIVRPHLEFAMDAGIPTLRACSIASVPCHTKKGLANSTSFHWNADASELTSSCIFKVCKGLIHLSSSDFFLRPPQAGLREHTNR